MITYSSEIELSQRNRLKQPRTRSSCLWPKAVFSEEPSQAATDAAHHVCGQKPFSRSLHLYKRKTLSVGLNVIRIKFICKFALPNKHLFPFCSLKCFLKELEICAYLIAFEKRFLSRELGFADYYDVSSLQ